jgi:hypothetical protein
MARFSAVPALPQSNISSNEVMILGALKENVELLTGTRGEPDNTSRALIKGQVIVNAAPEQTMTRVSATGSGFTISGTQVAGLEDFSRLISDVQKLANDVANIRATLNALIQQLKV